MELNNFENIDYEDASKGVAIKVLSNKNDVYALWMEKDKLVMEINYSKKDNQIKALGGTLGESIAKAELTEEQKAERCSEALQHGLWEFYHNQNKSNIKNKPR